MYLWRMDRLKDKLRNEVFSEKEIFSYIFGWCFLSIISYLMHFYLPQNPWELWGNIAAWGFSIVFMVSLVLAFRANGGERGTQFAAKYFSIGFVASIRVIVLLHVPLLILLSTGIWYLYFKDNYHPALDYLYVINILAPLLVTIVLYSYIVKSIHDVATPNNK